MVTFLETSPLLSNFRNCVMACLSTSVASCRVDRESSRRRQNRSVSDHAGSSVRFKLRRLFARRHWQTVLSPATTFVARRQGSVSQPWPWTSGPATGVRAARPRVGLSSRGFLLNNGGSTYFL